MELKINNKMYCVQDEDLHRTLLDWLRETADLTGAKAGCNIGLCGSCTVLVNGKARLACKTALEGLQGAEITTIEGFGSPEGSLHVLQQAFIDHGAIQCGFCTPGMVLRAHAFLMRKPNPTREEIRRGISPNLCRCTGYQQIVDAVEAASRHYNTE